MILAIWCRVDGVHVPNDDADDDVPCNRCCAIDNAIGWHRPMMTCNWKISTHNAKRKERNLVKLVLLLAQAGDRWTLDSLIV